MTVPQTSGPVTLTCPTAQLYTKMDDTTAPKRKSNHRAQHLPLVAGHVYDPSLPHVSRSNPPKIPTVLPVMLSLTINVVNDNDGSD